MVRIAHLTDLHIACLHCAITEGYPGVELTRLLRATEASTVDGVLAALLVIAEEDRHHVLDLIRRAVAEYRTLCDESAHACV